MGQKILKYFLLWLEKNDYLKKPLNTKTIVDEFNYQYRNINTGVGSYVRKKCPNCSKIKVVRTTATGYQCPSCLLRFK